MGTGAAEPRPFRVGVPDEVLTDLHERLDRVRWADQIPGSTWEYGTDSTYLRDLVTYWRHGYDWRAQEARINELDHFTVPLAGIDVHFVHAPGVGPDPMPLLLCHGWPGSFWEFHRILPLLTDPGRHGGDPADAFTVVAPSLPGYGFSFRPGQRRFDIGAIAEVLGDLMTEVLGYDSYAAQGGDWGGGIVSRLGADRPKSLVGIHLNLLFARPGVTVDPSGEPDAEERAALEAVDHWLKEETGYGWIQGTRPQTLAYALTDSPVGLAAWIVEKFRAWSDCGGDVESRFSRDVLLTNIMLYWVTGAIGSSFWPYYAVRHGSPVLARGQRVGVPTGYAAFPKEIVRPIRRWAEQVYDIRRWTEMPSGGHFAALEEPEALAEDVRAFFRDLR
jgi:pimeloyl-ACP methyl ester carboxylesterase